MREIKFRGLEVEGNEKGSGGSFVFGSAIYCEDDVESTISNSRSEHQVLTETVGQYTGLKDKNGKYIYEGDIVKIILEEYCAELSYVVLYEPLWASFVLELERKHGKCDYISFRDKEPFLEGDEVEVIGNIHEGIIK